MIREVEARRIYREEVGVTSTRLPLELYGIYELSSGLTLTEEIHAYVH